MAKGCGPYCFGSSPENITISLILQQGFDPVGSVSYCNKQAFSVEDQFETAACSQRHGRWPLLYGIGVALPVRCSTATGQSSRRQHFTLIDIETTMITA